MTTFKEPLKIGTALGVSNDALGTVPAFQTASVTTATNADAFRLPNGSRVIRGIVNVTTAYNASAAASLQIGTSGNATRFAAIGVSAAGQFEVLCSAAAVSAASGYTQVALTFGGSAASGVATVFLEYLPEGT